MKLLLLAMIASGLFLHAPVSAQLSIDSTLPRQETALAQEVGEEDAIPRLEPGSGAEPSAGRLVAGRVGAAAGVAPRFALGPSLVESGCERGEACSGAQWVQNGAFVGVYLFTTVLTPYGVHPQDRIRVRVEVAPSHPFR